MIKKRRIWLEVHEQIQVAVRASLAPGDRSEYGDPMRATFRRHAHDLRAASAQPIETQHVIGHPSRVSPCALGQLSQRLAERQRFPRYRPRSTLTRRFAGNQIGRCNIYGQA